MHEFTILMGEYLLDIQLIIIVALYKFIYLQNNIISVII